MRRGNLLGQLAWGCTDRNVPNWCWILTLVNQGAYGSPHCCRDLSISSTDSGTPQSVKCPHIASCFSFWLWFPLQSLQLRFSGPRRLTEPRQMAHTDTRGRSYWEQYLLRGLSHYFHYQHRVLKSLLLFFLALSFLSGWANTFYCLGMVSQMLILRVSVRK